MGLLFFTWSQLTPSGRVVTEEPGSEDLPSFFSFSHFTQATFRGNLKTIHSEPAWVLLFVVAVTWGIYLQPWATDPDAQEAHELARPMPLMRPSLRSAYVTPGPSNHIHWGSKSQNNGNLDANRGDNEILLSWLRSVTSFKRDLNVYIWEPHTKFPSTEHAKILICPPRDHKGVMRIVISLRSCRLHAAYIKSRDAYLAEQSVPTPGGQDPQPWSNALLSILCVLEVLVSDTDEFLRAYHNESARMVSIPSALCETTDFSWHWLTRSTQRVVSRQNPTISKLRFMMHLEDSRKIASDGTKHAMNVLDNLAVWAEQNTQTRTETRAALLHVDKMAAIREDLEFCDREIERLGSYTETDQQTLRQHFQLSQDLTLFRLTLLAAIFLPLSFTTSLFGMNMKNADEGFGTFSEFKNDTLGNITGNITDNSLRNITEALVSIISTSGNLNYDWAVFAGTAIGLTFILPLTLAVGAIMRTTVVSVVRYIKYWRALTLLIAGIILLAVMAISILGGFLGRVFWAQFYNSVGYGPGNIDRWISSWYGFGTNYQYAPPGWGSRLRWADYLLYPYWAINGLLLLMLIFLLYQSWSEGKERFFWTTQLLVTASCFTIDFMLMAYPLFPFMVIPWVWLGFFNAWVRPRGWKLFARWWTALFARWR